MLRPDLSLVDHAQDESVGDRGSEFLHEVQGKRRSSGPQRMEISHLRIQTDTLQRGFTFGAEQCIAKGEQGVCAVLRRPSTATSWGECLTIRSYHQLKGGEVGARCIPFEAAQCV